MEKTQTDENMKENKVYEASFNLNPFLSEEALAQEFSKIKENLTKAGAIFIAEQYPKMMDLAYTMTKIVSNKALKFNSAFFGWVKFEVSPDAIEAFKNAMKMDDEVIRSLIILTVRENTLAPKKVFAPREGAKRKSDDKSTEGEATEVVEEAPMDKESVDQKIEELVA